MLFAKKCQFVLNLDLVKIRLEIMLNYFKERNEISLTLKMTFFFKGVNPCFWSKKCHFFLYLDLIKMRLEMMLSEFAIKRETFFDLKKHNFSKFKKIPCFFKGVNTCSSPKNANLFSI